MTMTFENVKTTMVKFKGVDERTFFYVDPYDVDAIQTIDAIKTNLQLSTANKDVIIIRTRNNFQFAVDESIEDVLRKLNMEVSE